ncbi:MAG: AAA family ATPase, partial [Myxococcales bacterium]|nr:AAA family ATPase [Myxococcales bacterium]
MLAYLHVRGLALLDDVALELGRGMNVLTGETGAGKSIIVDALMLLRGARGRADLVRKGADAARVEGQFEVDAGAQGRIEPVLADLDLDPSWREGLILERVISRSGRGRSAIQSTLTTQATLERVGEELIDICSQHEHHSLTNVGLHLDLLDILHFLDHLHDLQHIDRRDRRSDRHGDEHGRIDVRRRRVRRPAGRRRLRGARGPLR